MTETSVAVSTPAGLAEGWPERLQTEFELQYMTALKDYLKARKQQKQVIYPHSRDWFRAFCLTPFDKVNVVILGQDPYHGPGQAHGLSFSVPKGVRTPPSLQNIYKEIQSDLNLPIPAHGCLESWAEQGVFLLNSVLTVEDGRAASHQGRGWERFTDAVIRRLSEDGQHRVFMLWGSYAQKKGQVIDSKAHLVLKSPHPSPLSAHRGFLGCKHFSQANEYLQNQGKAPIDWSVPA